MTFMKNITESFSSLVSKIPMAKMAHEKTRDLIVGLARIYIKDRYGKTADLCAVWAEHDGIAFSTSYLNKWLPKSKNIGRVIRRMCADNTALRTGIPAFGDEPSRIILWLLPSTIFTLGIPGYKWFAKEWPGDSRVGDIVVIEYSTLI